VIEQQHAPQLNAQMFRCPHCAAVTQQEWSNVRLIVQDQGNNTALMSGFRPAEQYRFSCCLVCRRIAIWYDKALKWPISIDVPPASPNMPNEVKTDYDEARAIYHLSPKAAAALLRLAIQRLCISLGGTGKDINADIGKLVEDGLPTKIQMALDVVRVIGNNAVHPGQIDIDDNPKVVIALFDLVNIVVEDMITQPTRIQNMFDELPQSSKDQIDKRDSK
jgi:Domain of unknown function (DUF4145)